MSESGHVLRENNEKIVKLMSLLRNQRDEMTYLIKKQQDERVRIQNEIEKLTFKLQLLSKSLNQRLTAEANYDKTIKEIEKNYMILVEDSGKLLHSLTKEVADLEQIMDKKTSTPGSIVTVPSNEAPPEVPEAKPTKPPKERNTRPSKEELAKPLKVESKPVQKQETKDEDEEEEENILKESKDLSDFTEEDSEATQNDLYKFPLAVNGASPPSSASSSPRRSNADKHTIKPAPPPIRNNLEDDDDEVQSFREAYGRTHTQSPPLSDVEGKAPRRLSIPKRSGRRRSDL